MLSIFKHSLLENLQLLTGTPFFLLVIAVEIFFSNYHHKKVYSFSETASNFFLSLANAGVDLLIRSVYFIILVFCFNQSFTAIRNPWIYWITEVGLIDICMYWMHRLEHQSRILWASHVMHHSAEYMNFSVEFRASVFQPLYRFIFFIPLSFVGFKPADIFLAFSFMQIWGLLVHTTLIKKLGWLEYVMVTPSHHRVHHASNIKYLDRNMGMCLIVWDKMFHTFQEELSVEEYEPIKYGLTKPLEKKDPVTVMFHEWKSIHRDLRKENLTWKQRLSYLFKAPGWSHDKSKLTSDEMRKLELQDKH